MVNTETIILFLIFICAVLLIASIDKSGGIIAVIMSIVAFFKDMFTPTSHRAGSDEEQEKNELECSCPADCKCREVCDLKCECSDKTRLNCDCGADCNCKEKCNNADICECFKYHGGCHDCGDNVSFFGGFTKWLGGNDPDNNNCMCDSECKCKKDCECPCCNVPLKDCFCSKDCICRPHCDDPNYKCECRKHSDDNKTSEEISGSYFGGFAEWLGGSATKDRKFAHSQIKRAKIGRGDIDYINDENISIIPLTTMDTKNITMAKLRTSASKLASLETFVDKLVNNTVILIRSLKKSPTDLTSSMLASHKTLLIAGADYIEKKPESRFVASALRELAKKAGYTISLHEKEMIKLGNISKEELAIKYAYLLSNGVSDGTVDLLNCKKDNEFLRQSNEKMREEIRRGLSNYTCEILLRDCLAEKDRLKREVEINRVSPFNSEKRVRELQNEVTELHGVIRALQQEERTTANIDAKYREQISKLEKEVLDYQNTLKELLEQTVGQ